MLAMVVVHSRGQPSFHVIKTLSTCRMFLMITRIVHDAAGQGHEQIWDGSFGHHIPWTLTVDLGTLPRSKMFFWAFSLAIFMCCFGAIFKRFVVNLC